VATGGVDALEAQEIPLTAYLERMGRVDPDSLSRGEALAYWINLYNAAALDLARRTLCAGHESVLDLRGGFTAPVITIGGEEMSLDGIEHGKIRRFGDPRIHAAVVCGSLSCPTLRHEPFTGTNIEDQLDEQMRHFLAAGGAVADPAANAIELSRIFRWYGGDLARPHRMPTLLPARARTVAAAISPWLAADMRTWLEGARPTVRFQRYEWGLGCAVRTAPGPP
jgi:hypothetical protein